MYRELITNHANLVDFCFVFTNNNRPQQCGSPTHWDTEIMAEYKCYMTRSYVVEASSEESAIEQFLEMLRDNITSGDVIADCMDEELED